MSIFLQRMGFLSSGLYIDPTRAWDADINARTGGSLFQYAGKLAEGPGWSSPHYSGGTVQINGQTMGSYDVINVDGPITLDQSTADSWSSATADSRSMWICVNGDLTIPNGITLTPGVRKLFMVLFVTGDLEISGQVTMSQRGADHSSATGSNISSIQIQIEDSWYIVASSVNGAATRSTNGQNNGGNATGNNSGGGGSGAQINGIAGGGAHGTCFSGGPGGGSCSTTLGVGSNGAIHGGAGGDGDGASSWAGGAGNPGGDGAGNGDDGDPGTGGTLIVFCQGELSGNGTITAIGARGGDATSTVGGGGSGGGSAHLLYTTDVSTISMNADGGLGGSGNTTNGGIGGDGTIRDKVIELIPAYNNPVYDASFGDHTGESFFHYGGMLSLRDVTASPQLVTDPFIINNQDLEDYEYMIVNGPITLDQATADSWSSTTADSVSTWIIVKGDLTIPNGITLIPRARKKFMVLFVTGNLIMNGDVTMTARGANHSSSGVSSTPRAIQVQFLWNITSAGANGGAKRSGSNGQNHGSNANAGGTGGGGSGGRYNSGAISGAGAAGTSYSGGGGGGSDASTNPSQGKDAEWRGGQGGDGSTDGANRCGGAGNPGGEGAGAGEYGDSGTGGNLVVLVQRTLSGDGDFTCHGSRGGDSSVVIGGGGSGGGVMHVGFAASSWTGAATATKGFGGSATQSPGGNGGNGSARTGAIQELVQ